MKGGDFGCGEAVDHVIKAHAASGQRPADMPTTIFHYSTRNLVLSLKPAGASLKPLMHDTAQSLLSQVKEDV